VLAVRRAVELGVDASAEGGIAEREGERARQLLEGNEARGRASGRSGVPSGRRSGRRSRPRCAIGTGERAYKQGEGGGRGAA